MRALDLVRSGRDAASLSLLYLGSPFAGRAEYDAVICHFAPTGERAVTLRNGRQLRGNVVIFFHGFDITSRVRALGDSCYAGLFASGALFATVSNVWRERLIALGCPPERLVVHRMGVDCRRFTFRARRRDAGVVRLLTIGRLVEKKGIAHAIRAVAMLRAQGLEVEYEVVGRGPLQAQLEALAAELSVSHAIRFHGTLSQVDVTRVLADAHIFLAPSVTAADGDMEGIPVSLMEAMACGVPVVSTNHSGIPELVGDGTSGILVSEGDASALAAAIARLVRASESWPAMGAAGRAFVEREHDIRGLNVRLANMLRARSMGRAGGGALPRATGGIHW